MGSRARLVLLLATVLVAVVLFLVLRPDGGEPTRSATTGETTTSVVTETETPATTAPEAPSAVRIRIQARGDGSGSIRRIAIERGQRVTLVVSADVADEVHVHGYDLMADVAPGSPARISFDASVPGRFEVELESRAIQIAELRVNP
jgi:heme/copper-type cytochrome/quinol oxidase subunit 2